MIALVSILSKSDIRDIATTYHLGRYALVWIEKCHIISDRRESRRLWQERVTNVDFVFQSTTPMFCFLCISGLSRSPHFVLVYIKCITSNSFPKSLPDLTNWFQLKELIIWIYIIWHVILPIRKDAVRWYRYSLP